MSSERPKVNKPKINPCRQGSPPRPVIHTRSLNNLTKNSFIQILASHVSLSKIKKFIECAQVPKNIPVNNIIAKLICFDCGMIKGLTRLNCSHLVCVGCFKKCLLDYENTPSLTTFKAIRCPQCQFLPTSLEIYYFLDEDPSRAYNFMNISVSKRCCWCTRKLDLMTEYLPELECLDLCRECYADQLFLRENSCMACKLPFRNINSTLQRKSICSVCNSVSYIVNSAMRSYYKNKVICYECHKYIVEEGNWATAFGEMDFKKGENLLRYYYNKNCPCCNTHKALSELNICKKCGNFKCDDCQVEDPKCYFCVVVSCMEI